MDTKYSKLLNSLTKEDILHPKLLKHYEDVSKLSEKILSFSDIIYWEEHGILEERNRLFKELQTQEGTLHALVRVPVFSFQFCDILSGLQDELMLNNKMHLTNEAYGHNFNEFVLQELEETFPFFLNFVQGVVQPLIHVFFGYEIQGFNSLHLTRLTQETLKEKTAFHVDSYSQVTCVFELQDRSKYNDKFLLFPSTEVPLGAKGEMSVFFGSSRHGVRLDPNSQERDILVLWST